MAGLMAAIQAKYDSLTGANFPGAARWARHMDKPPQVVSGAQLYPPYVVLSLAPGGPPDLTFEADALETSTLTVTAYDEDSANTAAAVACVRFNGSAVSAGAGFDAGTLPALTDGTLLSMLPGRPPVTTDTRMSGKTGKRVFQTTMTYEILVQRT